MFPHERSLVAKLKDKPFALLGVNGDDPAKLKKIVEDNQLTWRSWACGGDGPIVKLYKVEGWPTIYVLDERGVIAAKNVRGAAMEAVIDRLLEKMGE